MKTQPRMLTQPTMVKLVQCLVSRSSRCVWSEAQLAIISFALNQTNTSNEFKKKKRISNTCILMTEILNNMIVFRVGKMLK